MMAAVMSGPGWPTVCAAMNCGSERRERHGRQNSLAGTGVLQQPPGSRTARREAGLFGSEHLRGSVMPDLRLTPAASRTPFPICMSPSEMRAPLRELNPAASPAGTPNRRGEKTAGRVPVHHAPLTSLSSTHRAPHHRAPCRRAMRCRRRAPHCRALRRCRR
jgi:hypothetical protein